MKYVLEIEIALPSGASREVIRRGKKHSFSAFRMISSFIRETNKKDSHEYYQ